MSLKANSFEALKNDRHSGSSELLRQTIQWMLDSLKAGQKSDTIVSQLRELCRRHPAMALLFSLLRFFEKIPVSSGRVQAWITMYQKHETAACRYFAQHLSKFKNILVHSNSGMLYATLKMLPDPLNVFCTESRPAFEGTLLAERLSTTPHRIYLIPDMAAFSVLHRVETVALGCDSITPRGIINKIGTAALAQMATGLGKRAYFVATSEKRMDWNDDLLLRQGARDEVYTGKAKIQVENYYFDLTEPQHIHGLFLENGMARGVFTV